MSHSSRTQPRPRLSRVVVFLAAALALAVLAPPPATASIPIVEISVIVHGPDGAPLAGADVRSTPRHQVHTRTVTDAEGRATFSTMQSGDDLFVDPPAGSGLQWVFVDRFDGEELGGIRQINVQLEPCAASGCTAYPREYDPTIGMLTVAGLDSQGEHFELGMVEVYAQDGDSWSLVESRHLPEWPSPTNFYPETRWPMGLLPGTYRVRVVPDEGQGEPVVHQGATALTSGTDIEVQTGSRQEIEVKLAEAAPGSITGRVVDPDGAAVTNIDVRVISGDEGVDPVTSRTDAQGRFHAEVPAGTYRLETATPSDPCLTGSSVAGIEVDSGEETSGVELRLGSTDCPQQPGTVSITGTPRTGAKLTAQVDDWEPGSMLSYRWLRDGTPITSATERTYRPVNADVKHRLSVEVTSDGGAQAVSPEVSIRRSSVLEQILDWLTGLFGN